MCYALSSKIWKSPDYKSEGTGIRNLPPLKGLDKASPIFLTAVLVRVQCFRNELNKVVKWPSTSLIVLSMITWSYWRRRRRLTIFEPDDKKFASPLTLLSVKSLLGHTDDVEDVSLFLSPTIRNSLRLWSSLVCRQDHSRRPGKWFL